MEGAATEVSWLNRHPEAAEKLVGMIQAEHMGEMDYREVDGLDLPHRLEVLHAMRPYGVFRISKFAFKEADKE